jgi:HK97 family phage prohead protease
MTAVLDEARIYAGVGVELRAEKVNGHQFLHGRAVPYDDPADIGWYLEEHAPGSLAKSIKEAARSLPLLLQHDEREFPIGVASEWDDSATALDGIWKLDNSDRAQEAARLATPDEDGNAMLGYMSIRFAPIRSAWEYAEDFNPSLGSDHKDKVRRLESRLVEVSLVSTPAFKNAAVEFVRTAERQRVLEDPTAAVKAWRAEFEKLRA